MTTTDTSPRATSTRPAIVQPRDIKPRVTPAEGVRQTLTLAWRTLIQIRHNPWELGDFSIQPILFVLLFTYVFGGAIADSPTEYLQYALPGIIVMNMFFRPANFFSEKTSRRASSTDFGRCRSRVGRR